MIVLLSRNFSKPGDIVKNILTSPGRYIENRYREMDFESGASGLKSLKNSLSAGKGVRNVGNAISKFGTGLTKAGDDISTAGKKFGIRAVKNISRINKELRG